MCMSSVISASLRWEGSMSESSEAYVASSAAVRDAYSGADGLLSERREDGDVNDEFIALCVCDAISRLIFGANAVALDMSRTSVGRTYLPSDWV